jgi:hypothetical protein
MYHLMRSGMRGVLLLAVIVTVFAATGVIASSVTSAASQGPLAPRVNLPPIRRHQRQLVHDFSGTAAVGIFRNLTPYPMTFVASGGLGSFLNEWAVDFPKTLNPGEQFTYRLNPYNDYATTQEYGGFFTYRADTLNHTEYLSLQLQGSHCTGICLPRDGPALSVTAYNAGAPPRSTSAGWDFGPKTTSPEIAWTTSGTTAVFPGPLFSPPITADFDFTFETQGTYSIDASKIPANQSGTLAQVLNELCQNKGQASCSFTPTSPLSFGTGALSPYFSEPNCSVNAPGREPLPAAPREVTVTQTREASLSVGGSASVGLEGSVFGVIEAGVSVKFGVEHEWTDDSEFSKTVRIFVPSGWVGVVWVAPEVGKVTGTMVMKTPKASYTITNLTEVKSGVQPDLLTPPYDLLFNARPMTKEEREKACPAVTRGTPPVGGRG